MLQEKLNTATIVAHTLNSAGIVWGIGASMLLWQTGLSDSFHDIDLLVMPNDAKQAHALLSELGDSRIGGSKSIYTTRFFGEYRIGEVELDVMADFGICNLGCHYQYPFDRDAIAFTAAIGGEPVPFTALEDWFVLYALMERDEKAARIEHHLLENDCGRPDRLQQALTQPLPATLAARVNSILRQTARHT